MKRITLSVVLLFLFALVTRAQQGQIKGQLTDSSSSQPLSDATVALLHGKDSSMAATVFTDKNGAFSLPGLAVGSYRLYITYLGYQPIFKTVNITEDKKVLNLGAIPLKSKGLTLNEVEIIREVPPVTVKPDTLEFNAGSFKTRENAMVEDLLKRLPGVQVDKDGVITAQGQTVKRILVDGKPFFSDDPKLATKNLPADIIDKIQLIDRKSDQAQFTGIDDGETEKAINITIKKDKKKGVFGRASAGYGTDDHFAVNASLNSFRDNRQLSFLGSGNNVNNLGYTNQDVFSFSSGGGGGGGGGRGAARSAMNSLGGNNSTGITRNWNAGFNYNEEFNDKLKVNGSYFINDTRTQKQFNSAKQTFQPDTTFYYDQNSASLSENTNHRLNMRVEYEIDSMHSLVVTPSFGYTSGKNYQNNDYASLDNNKLQTIEGNALNTTNATSPTFSTTALFRKKFQKRGRTLSANLNFGFNTSDKETFNKSTDKHLQTDSTFYTSGFDRLTDGNNTGRNVGVRLTYTEPVFKDRYLEFTYAWNRNFSSADNKTYDNNGTSGKYDLLNDSLSNRFDNVFATQRAGISLRTQKFKYDYSIGLNIQFSNLDNTNISRDTHIEQQTVNFFPSASFNYTFDKNKRLRFRYNGNSQQPTVQQLQPLPDLSSSIYVQEGNPDLKPAFSHNINMGYNSFNVSSMRGFFTNLNATFTQNKIVNSNRSDTAGKQYTKPMNANGAYNLNWHVVNSFPIKKLNSTLNTNTSFNYSRDVSFSATNRSTEVIKTFTQDYGVTQGLSFTYFFKELFDISTNASANYSAARYSIQKTNNTNYFNYNFSVDANLNLPAGFIIGADLNYSLNTGRSDGYNIDVTMLNAFVSKNVFKDKRGLVKISGYDLLNRNVSISRNVGENYIEDVQNMVLQRYFMISLTYFLNKFGNNNEKGRSNENGPRMRMPGRMGMPGGGGFRRG